MDSPCIKQTVCKVLNIFQHGKYLVAYVLNNQMRPNHESLVRAYTQKLEDFLLALDVDVDEHFGETEAPTVNSLISCVCEKIYACLKKDNACATSTKKITLIETISLLKRGDLKYI